MLPPESGFVDEEHDGGIGDDTHKVGTQTAVEASGALFVDDEPQRLHQTGVFDLAVYEGLP